MSLPDPLHCSDLIWVGGPVTSEHSCLPRPGLLLTLEFALLLFCDESSGSWMDLPSVFITFLLCCAVSSGSSLRRGAWDEEDFWDLVYDLFFSLSNFMMMCCDVGLFSSISIGRTCGFWSGNSFLQFCEIFFLPSFLPYFLLSGTLLEQLLGLLDWSSAFIFYLIVWHYFLVGLLNYPSVEFFIYAVIFLRFLFCSLNFRDNILFLFHGCNIYQ